MEDRPEMEKNVKEKCCDDEVYEASVSFKKSKEVELTAEVSEEMNKNVRSKLVSIGKSVVPQELKEDIAIPSDSEDED